MSTEATGTRPKNWDAICDAKKRKCRYVCEVCGLQCRWPDEEFDSHQRSMSVMTYPDRNPANCVESNLKAVCHACFLNLNRQEHQEKAKETIQVKRETVSKSALIGRDNLISNEIIPRLKKRLPFRLEGQAGVGKTALLRWAYNYCDDQFQAYISCDDRHTQIVTIIAKALAIEDFEKKNTTKLEGEIIGTKHSISLFVDHLESIKPQTLNILKAIKDQTNWCVYFASKSTMLKENIKPIVWGVQKITVRHLTNDESFRLASLAIQHVGAAIAPKQVVDHARGVPGRIWAFVKGEVLPDDEKVEGEKFVIGPLIGVAVVALCIGLRYTGRAAGQGDMYLLGGLGMAFAIILTALVKIGK